MPSQQKRAGGRDRFLVLSFGISGLVAAMSITGATPLASDHWNLPVLLVGLLLAVVLAWVARQAWPFAGSGLRLTAIAVGVLALLSAGIGATSQNSVNGRVQLRGSTLDRAIEMRAAMAESVAILADNQRLFTLTDEQALGLDGTFRAAFEQAVQIGERWNPATLGEPPLPEIAAVAEIVNLAAARQAAAFERRMADLVTPEASVRAQALELADQVEALLGGDLPVAFSAVDVAIEADSASGNRESSS